MAINTGLRRNRRSSRSIIAHVRPIIAASLTVRRSTFGVLVPGFQVVRAEFRGPPEHRTHEPKNQRTQEPEPRTQNRQPRTPNAEPYCLLTMNPCRSMGF